MSAESSAYLREDQRPESAALAETLQMAVHLRGQLQRGREDHRADVVGVVVVQALDQRNQVRGCLARTRGSDAEKVAILDHHGNRLHLDGSRLLVFEVLDVVQNGFLQGQLITSEGHCFKRGYRRRNIAPRNRNTHVMSKLVDLVACGKDRFVRRFYALLSLKIERSFPFQSLALSVLQLC